MMLERIRKMNLFKPNKWDSWYDSLPEHTKQWLKNQPIWHDKDVAFFVCISLVVGFIIGFFTGYN